MGPIGPIGPQGLQGIQGIRGPVGDPFTIVGTLTTTTQLPSPEETNRNYAYLIPDEAGDEHIWVIIGEDDDLMWHDAGSFGGGVKASSEANVVYSNDSLGTVGTTPFSTTATPSTIVQRDSRGNVGVALAPINDSDAASKNYVDDQFDTLQSQVDTIDSVASTNKQDITTIKNTFIPKSSATNAVYANNGNGTPTTVSYSQAANANYIVQRIAAGQITVPATPTATTNAASKGYVDSQIASAVPKKYMHCISFRNSAGTLLANFNYINGSNTAITTLNALYNEFVAKGISTTDTSTSAWQKPFLVCNGAVNSTTSARVITGVAACTNTSYQGIVFHCMQIVYVSSGAVAVGSYANFSTELITLTSAGSYLMYDNIIEL